MSRGMLYLLLLLVALLVVLALYWTVIHLHDHPAGRDTVDYFGNGRFQILQGIGHQSLHDVETQNTLVYIVHDWRKAGDRVYAVGKEDTKGRVIYVVLNYRTGSHDVFHEIAQAPMEYRGELSKLKR